MISTQKATRAHTREHNRQLVLHTIYFEGEISLRASIARATELTRPTVSAIVADLLDEAIVAEIGHESSEGGKPAILLSVVDDSRHLIGLDLASSVFRGAVVDLRGNVCHRVDLPVQERDGEAALDLVYQLLDTLVAAARSPILGIGIGAPGLMDANQGLVYTAVNLDWQNLPLGDLLFDRYGIPAYIANDSQVAALGEYTFGNVKDIQNLVVFKVGRGIGAGIIIDGELYYGDGFGAGEIGHLKVVEGGEPCRCGHFGCLETLSSTRAIVRQARAIAVSLPDSKLHPFAQSAAAINTETVLQAYRAGDSALDSVIFNAGRYLGVAAAAIVSILNIQHIVVAGTAAHFGDGLLSPMQNEMERRSLSPLSEATTLSTSNLGDDIIILGAAALLLSNELGITG